MNKLLILTSYTKFEVYPWRNNEITIKLLIQTFFTVMTQRKSEMTSYLNNGYDVMNCFGKFEKFLPHSIIIPSFMSVGGQMPELDWGGAFCPPPPYKIGSQNTPYKFGLNPRNTLFLSPCISLASVLF